MKMFNYILVGSLLFSCGNKEQKKTVSKTNTITRQENQMTTEKKTTKEYDI